MTRLHSPLILVAGVLLAALLLAIVARAAT